MDEGHAPDRRPPLPIRLALLAALAAALPLGGLLPSAAAAQRAPAGQEGPVLTIVLRYDDWSASAALTPKQAAADLRVLALASQYRVPLSVAVVPAAAAVGGADAGFAPLRRGDRMVEALVRASRAGPVNVVLHGLHHTDRSGGGARGSAAELAGLPLEEQTALLRSGIAALEEAGLPPPAAMVPPWNAYDAETCRACAEAGMEAISADFDGPPPPPGCPVRLLPQIADLPQVARRDRLLALAARLRDPGAVAVVMMHRFDFEECRSKDWPVYTSLAGLDELLAELRADPRVRLATLAQVVAEQGDALSGERFEAARTLTRRVRLLMGLHTLPYRVLPDPAELRAYWSLPTYRALNRRAALLIAASFGAMALGWALVAGVLLAVLRRRPWGLGVGTIAAAAGAVAFALSRPVAKEACLVAGLLGLLAPLAVYGLFAAARRPRNAEASQEVSR